MKFITDYKIELSVIVDADNIEMARIMCDRLEQDLGIKILSKPEFDYRQTDRGCTNEYK
jgi:hypothetical protein